MKSRIILVSNDSDFFEYIFSKLLLRKNDEILRLKFDEIPENLEKLHNSLLIINSENFEEQTLALMDLCFQSTNIIFAFNEILQFKINVYKKGAFAFLTPMNTDEEFQAIILSALHHLSIYTKNLLYSKMLIKKNIINNNGVLLEYSSILDQELEKQKQNSSYSILMAISPDDTTKFLLLPNQIETIILSNIRSNDLLINYAVNKYFLLLYDTDLDNAKKIWSKISKQLPENVYAGFAKTFSKNRQQLINEALGKLHEAISSHKRDSYMQNNYQENCKKNFKLYRQELNKKIENIVVPTFYHIDQKYGEKLFGVKLEHECSEGACYFKLTNHFATANLKITTPGFTNINIDVTYTSSPNNIDAKRISLTPEEFEAGLLEDLLEQFILEFKKEIDNGTT